MRLASNETQVNDQLTGAASGNTRFRVALVRMKTTPDSMWRSPGLKFGDAGSFDYGRNYGVVYDVTSGTDVLPEFGGRHLRF